MENLIKIVHFFATNLWFPMMIAVILITLQIGIPVWKANRAPAVPYTGPWKKLILTCGMMMALAMCIIELPDWSSSLLYHHGEDGTGVITRKERTNNMFNNQYVMKYVVLIKRANGTTVEAQFESSDFNIYPSENAVVYPEVGEKFALRYLPSAPKIFVILTNKKSEYTSRLACREAFDKVAEARIKFESDSLNKAYRHEYAQALEQLLQADCYKGQPLEAEFIQIDKGTMERLKSKN